MALDFQLMGSHATTGAQLEQIKHENEAASKVVKKKAEELRPKVKKPDESFKLFKLAKKMPKEALSNIKFFASIL